MVSLPCSARTPRPKTALLLTSSSPSWVKRVKMVRKVSAKGTIPPFRAHTVSARMPEAKDLSDAGQFFF